MRNNKIWFLILCLILLALITVVTGLFLRKQKTSESVFKENREKVLSQLYLAIGEAKEMGKYKCCIEPPCTMCYLGDWIFKDGSCDCDTMIAKGELDKVCPQCIKGIKEGKCKSTKGTCLIF